MTLRSFRLLLASLIAFGQTTLAAPRSRKALATQRLEGDDSEEELRPTLMRSDAIAADLYDNTEDEDGDERSDISSLESEDVAQNPWGAGTKGWKGCKCKDMPNQPMQARIQSIVVNYPAGMSTCGTWDKDVRPDCVRREKADSSCDSLWCFVDRTNCDLAEEPQPFENFIGVWGNRGEETFYYSTATCTASPKKHICLAFVNEMSCIQHDFCFWRNLNGGPVCMPSPPQALTEELKDGVAESARQYMEKTVDKLAGKAKAARAEDRSEAELGTTEKVANQIATLRLKDAEDKAEDAEAERTLLAPLEKERLSNEESNEMLLQIFSCVGFGSMAAIIFIILMWQWIYTKAKQDAVRGALGGVLHSSGHGFSSLSSKSASSKSFRSAKA